MASSELGIARSGASEFLAQTLPDGSLALFEVATSNVYSLRPSAAAAWEACSTPTTLTALAAEMSRRLNEPVTEDQAYAAVSELEAVGLVTLSEPKGTTRRQLLKQAAEVGIPLVLVLTAADQRAHAQGAGSNPPPPTTAPVTTPPATTPPPPSTPPPTTPPPTTPPPTTAAPGPPTRRFEISKFTALTPDQVVDREPLPGAQFDVINITPGHPSNGQVVAQITTDGNGVGSANLIPGLQYRLVETFAPPSLDAYEPFEPISFTMQNTDGFGFDLSNVLKAG